MILAKLRAPTLVLRRQGYQSFATSSLKILWAQSEDFCQQLGRLIDARSTGRPNPAANRHSGEEWWAMQIVVDGQENGAKDPE